MKGNLAAISGLVDQPIASVCQLIDAHVVSGLSPCNRLIEDFRTSHGKMIRPRLLLLSGGACGNVRQDHIIAAAVFQIMHDAMLLHDDVIDQGLVRRHAATINSRWGNKAAILMGDLFLSHAVKLCAALGEQALSIAADTLVRTCEGEIHQDLGDGAAGISEGDYMQIIRMKTSEMFGQCCYLGALLSGAESGTCRRFQAYGLLIGTAFQISDDLMDLCGDETQLGKSVDRDAQGQVMTLPVIHYIEQGKDWRELNAMPREKAVEQLTESGSLAYCTERVRQLCQEAAEQLAFSHDNEYLLALRAIADAIASCSAVSGGMRRGRDLPSPT